MRRAVGAHSPRHSGPADQSGILPTNAFEDYESRPPSIQNCIDAIPGWNSQFPPEYDVVAGNRVPFLDDRILWAIERFGGVAGADVLEIGPMEGGHTYLLHQNGATITAVEASKRAFLKCLVTKEITNLSRARFLLGDGVQYLENVEKRYDLIVACAVLYHMRDPIRFLEAAAARTDALYVWTSSFDESILPPEQLACNPFDTMREIREFNGISITLYRRDYADVHQNPDFCGGIYNEPRWMSRSSILDVLKSLGFNHLEIAHERRPHPTESCFSVFARRILT